MRILKNHIRLHLRRAYKFLVHRKLTAALLILTSLYSVGLLRHAISLHPTHPAVNVVLPPEALKHGDGAPYTIAVCALVQNEAPYIPEWIAYHRLIGIQHFFIYDNNSTDDLEAAVAPFAARGWATIVKPSFSTNGTRVREFQNECYTENEAAMSAHWLASLDVDEFLVVPGASIDDQFHILPRLLSMYEDDLNCSGLVIDRYSFTSGAYIDPPKHGLVIENYVEREIEEVPPKEFWPKILGIPKRMVFDSPHWYDEEESQGKACLSDGKLPDRWGRTKVFEPLRIQHYEYRSNQECLEKLARRAMDMGTDDWRVRVGKEHCNRVLHTGEGYDASNYVNDNTLSTSLWPQAIKLFLEKTMLF